MELDSPAMPRHSQTLFLCARVLLHAAAFQLPVDYVQ
jgi:hypothetical protein